MGLNIDEKVQIVSGENALALNIKKLQIGRIDAVIEDQAVFKHYLHRTKTQNEFLEAGLAYIEAVYISFSPQLKKANEYADILTGGMKELRKSGKLAKILKKYGLDDWRQ